MLSSRRRQTLVPVTLLAAAGLLGGDPALAHHAMDGQTPASLMQGLLSGLAHPVIGIDHLAFLVVVALLAFGLLEGVRRFLAPALFVAGTLGGTLAHLQGMDLPLAETLVAASVLIGGVLALSGLRLGAAALLALLGVAGMFHGYAYGESIVGAEATPLAGYLVGFSLIQYALIAGAVMGLAHLAERSRGALVPVTRSGAAFAVAVGGLLLVGSLV